MIRMGLLTCVPVAVLALMAHPPLPPGSFSGRCDAPETDGWVRELRDRFMLGSMTVWTVERLGEPTSCEGTVTRVYEGVKYGSVVLGFAGGGTLGVETMPPETSIVTLRVPGGFSDDEDARRMVETYAAEIGLRIDWSGGIWESEGKERVRTFRDPDEGLNASVSFFYSGEDLMALRVSMAL